MVLRISKSENSLLLPLPLPLMVADRKGENNEGAIALDGDHATYIFVLYTQKFTLISLFIEE